MATTVVAPTNNSIGLISKYLPLLDQVYKRESLTSMLDTAEARVRWTGAKTVNIMNLNLVGMGNYDRDNGYVAGKTTATWEPYTIEIDRGRAYQFDEMDNEEALSMVVGNALGVTERENLIPEMDAYRFAKWAGTTGVTSVGANIVPGTTNVADLIDTAEAQMDNDEVPYEGRILFINPQGYNVLKGNVERRIINSEDNVNTNIEFYDDMRIIRVPQSRFNTAVTLNAPVQPTDVGGYTATGDAINFMIVHPSAILQVVKHNTARLFTPSQFFEMDGYRLNYRVYHDTFVLKNKVKGIYVHHAV